MLTSTSTQSPEGVFGGAGVVENISGRIGVAFRALCETSPRTSVTKRRHHSPDDNTHYVLETRISAVVALGLASRDLTTYLQSS